MHLHTEIFELQSDLHSTNEANSITYHYAVNLQGKYRIAQIDILEFRDGLGSPRKTPTKVPRTNWIGLGCSKANCSLLGLGPVGGVISVVVFLRDPNLYLSEFRLADWL